MRKWSVYDFVENVEDNYLYTGLLSYEEEAMTEEGDSAIMSKALFSVELNNGVWWIQLFWFLNFMFGDWDGDDNYTGAT